MIKHNFIKKLFIGLTALSGALVLGTKSNAYYNGNDIGYYYGVGDYGLNDIYDYSYIGEYKNITWSKNCNYLLKEYLNQNNDSVYNYCLGNASRWFDSNGNIRDYDKSMVLDNNSYQLSFISYAYDVAMGPEFEAITKQSESEDINVFYLYTPDNSCFSYESCGTFSFNDVYSFQNANSLILEFYFNYNHINLNQFTYVSGNTKTLTLDNLNKYVLILSCDNTLYDFDLHNDGSKNLISYDISPLSCGFTPSYSYWDAIAFTDGNSNSDGLVSNLTTWLYAFNDLSPFEYNNHYAVYVQNNRRYDIDSETLGTINSLNSQIHSLSTQLNELKNANLTLINQVNTLTLARDNLVNQLASYNNMTYQDILRLGYNQGQASVSNTNATLMGLFGAIANVPIIILNGVMGPTLLGVPLITILLNFLSVLLILWLIKKFIK